MVDKDGNLKLGKLPQLGFYSAYLFLLHLAKAMLQPVATYFFMTESAFSITDPADGKVEVCSVSL